LFFHDDCLDCNSKQWQTLALRNGEVRGDSSCARGVGGVSRRPNAASVRPVGHRRDAEAHDEDTAAGPVAGALVAAGHGVALQRADRLGAVTASASVPASASAPAPAPASASAPARA